MTGSALVEPMEWKRGRIINVSF